MGRHAEQFRGALEDRLFLAHAFERGRARERLDPAQVRPDRTLGHDLDRPDRPECVHVRSPAQLGRPVAGLDDANHVAVLVAEEGDRTHAFGLLLRRLVRAHRLVGKDALIGQTLDLVELLAGDRPVVAEVEAEAVGCDERSRLLDVRTEHLS